MAAQMFYLPNLETTVSQTTLATMNSAVSALTQLGDYDAQTQVNVDYTLLQNMFNFYTSSANGLDFGTAVGKDATDLKYRVVWSTATQPLGININSNTTVFDGYMGTYPDAILALDWTRHLAKQLFNTIEGVDLFSNEETIRSALATAFSSDINAKFVGLNSTAGVVYNSAAASRNASQVILDQIVNTGESAARLSSLIPTADANWYKCPILPGDAVFFKVIITAAATQKSLTGVTSIADRRYIVKINAVAPA